MTQSNAQQLISKRAELIALAYEMYGFKWGDLTTIGKPAVQAGSDLGMLISAVRRSQVVEIYQHPQTHEWMVELNTEGDHPVARAVGAQILVGRQQWAMYAALVTQHAHVPQWNGYGYGDNTDG